MHEQAHTCIHSLISSLHTSIFILMSTNAHTQNMHTRTHFFIFSHNFLPRENPGLTPYTLWFNPLTIKHKLITDKLLCFYHIDTDPLCPRSVKEDIENWSFVWPCRALTELIMPTCRVKIHRPGYRAGPKFRFEARIANFKSLRGNNRTEVICILICVGHLVFALC